MQVLSRLTLVWGILTPTTFAAATRPSVAYSSMLLAWSVTEIIRYSYFVFNLQGARRRTRSDSGGPGSGGTGTETGTGSGDKVPSWLVWARYNFFYVLYPLGTSSECVLVLKASLAAGWRAAMVAELDGEGSGSGWVMVQWALRALLVVYIPGFYVLFTHMVKQRRKVMRGKGVER